MSDDPYKTLGVGKSATQAEIKKAYRALAKKLHPDLHPGDAGKQAEFQAVAAAYDLLGDAEKRRRYDAGEIDASGQERPERQYYRHYAEQDAGRRYDAGGAGQHGFDADDLGDLFSDLFGRRQAGAGGYSGDFSARGPDLRYRLDIPFLDAVRGVRRKVTMPDGNAIEISVPAGVRDGQTLRLRGKGGPGYGKGAPGDALVTIGVAEHPVFRRDGDDLEIELPITVDEAVLGAKVEVPTIGGPVAMTIPKGASSGDRLRLRGRGVAPAGGKAGDQYVRLKIVLPDRIDDGLEELARDWRSRSGFDPRKDLRRQT
ncbi:DnaJ domain-containing protein [Rhodobacterales bacterium HKCCE2091]|nr:DnaJ domain-containing protein [Rhodobacterales bacterium HKCCE2091]